MVRLLVLLALGSLACRWLTGHWPWTVARGWLRTRPTGEERARSLLGVSPGAGREEIIAAHRKLVFAVHPDRGGSEALVHEANDARDRLLAALGPANRA